ncbi:MAG: hypothetical protein J0H19_13830 [Rhodospirillales bacterium]|nr:hypothetical protein [Rhodospirillales bacterium]
MSAALSRIGGARKRLGAILLVLFLVMQAEGDECVNVGREIGMQQALMHGGVDMAPIAQHVIERGAREQAALRARMARTGGLVI